MRGEGNRMGRILNALRYGNAKTKRYIISIVLLLILGGVSIIRAVRFGSPLWAMVGVFAFLLVVVFINSLKFIEGQELNPRNQNKTKDRDSFDKEKSFKDKGKDVSSVDEDEQEADELATENENYIEQYDEKKLKKLFYYYKVKKNHIPILIDSWESKKIKQCPAYLWMDKSHLHVLTIGKEANKYELPRKQLLKLTYDKGRIVNRKEDYYILKTPSLLSLAFSGFLPTVYEEGEGIRATYKKNLYVIGSDLKITNTSAKSVFDLLQADFSLLEEELYTKRYSPYFTSAYKLNILLKDGVLSVSDYKRKIKEVLLALAQAEISLDVFKTYMNQLIQGRLITKEYAEYYVEYRMKQKERSGVIERQ